MTERIQLIQVLPSQAYTTNLNAKLFFMTDTNQQYDQAIEACKEIFLKKNP